MRFLVPLELGSSLDSLIMQAMASKLICVSRLPNGIVVDGEPSLVTRTFPNAKPFTRADINVR